MRVCARAYEAIYWIFALHRYNVEIIDKIGFLDVTLLISVTLLKSLNNLALCA